MKKDKAVRKANAKAALAKRLKGLIAPALILAVIAVGVLVITFWREDEEPAEIVKVNAFEGNEEQYILENDKLLFVMDAKTTQFSVTVKDTGKVWYSNPQEANEDPLALGQEKSKLKSTLLLTYSTINGVDTLYNNYDYSMEKGIYEIEQNGDSIKVKYSLGDVEKEFVIPPVIPEERMNALTEAMDQSGKQLVRDYYKKYDINNLGKNDDKEVLLANYPILETQVIYVLRDGVKDSIKSKFEKVFGEAGYAYEEYLEHKELDLSEAVSDKPIFNVNIIYRLEGEDLLVEVPVGEMECKKDYPIYSLCVLPYFGAAQAPEEGFVLVPEGGGAIIDFNNGKTGQSNYYANVYGWDMGQNRSAVVHETRASFNVFGLADSEESFLCILEKGAPYASIQADISGKTNSYNYANAVYNILYREQYDIADRFTGSMYVYEENLPQESLVQRYRFISSDSYVDMAVAYREYLLKEYEGYMALKQDQSTPIGLEILGAADKAKQVLGIPVSKPLKLTTYKEAKELIEELRGEGMDNLWVKFSGWANGGVRQKLLSKVKLVSQLGSKKDFKALTQYAEENGIPLYLNGIVTYAYDSGLFDGFLVFRDAAKFVSRESAELYSYSTITYGQETGYDPYYLLRANLGEEMMSNLAESAAEYHAYVSLEDVGRDLSSDFTADKTVRRQEALENQRAQLKELRDSGMRIMINGGNDYATPYSDMVTNMDLIGSKYSIIDRAVPFYQIAIHGYVNYTGESLNLAQNWEEELLASAEYGAGLSFTLMKETAFILQNTKYTKYFGADYAAWHDRMMEIYKRYDEELGGIFDQKITNHERLTESLSCTTYEDGTKVYVNYGYSDVTAKDGTKVGARDYKAVP